MHVRHRASLVPSHLTGTGLLAREFPVPPILEFFGCFFPRVESLPAFWRAAVCAVSAESRGGLPGLRSRGRSLVLLLLLAPSTDSSGSCSPELLLERNGNTGQKSPGKGDTGTAPSTVLSCTQGSCPCLETFP